MEPNPIRSPRRVLMTADTIGGVWTYALELTRALEPHGIEILLATMGTRLNRAQIKEANLMPNLEICESHFKLEWMKNPWRDVARAGDWLLELAAQRHPDVIHLNGYAHGALPWPAPVMVVAHSCVLSWWQAVKGQNAPPDYDHYREVVAGGIRAADLVVAPSAAMLGAVREHYGPLRQSEVIYNGRNPDLFQPGVKEDLVFTAGRLWDEAKNLAALAAVAPDLPWPIHVAGEMKPPDGRKSKHAHIHPLGRLSSEELAPWFAKASIYVLPAQYEPFGLSPLEAALAGCALVLGDIPSLREIWGDAALFVPPNDHPALKAALDRLISNRPQLNRMAGRALVRALEFTPRKMAKRYFSAYSRLMQMTPARAKELMLCES